MTFHGPVPLQSHGGPLRVDKSKTQREDSLVMLLEDLGEVVISGG